MISYPQALRTIVDAIRPLAPQTGTVLEPGHGASAATVTSALDVPDFDNSAMDGFAVLAEDTAHATPTDPVVLPVTGTVAAGDPPGARAVAGQAIEIMTGAPMPTGCDAVIPVEKVSVRRTDDGRPETISIHTPAGPGMNLRRAGEDFRRGESLLDSPRILDPHVLMALAAGGIDELPVRRRAGVAVISTGAELAASGKPSGTGKIRDVNRPYLKAAVPRFNGRLLHDATVTDRLDDIVQALSAVPADCQLIVTTGGVSAGRYDAVPEAVRQLGGTILFHKVAIRPGKPVLFASLPNDRWLFGLPGNPIAVAVGLRFFVAPALRRFQNLGAEQTIPAITSTEIRKRPDLRFFGKAVATAGTDARITVSLLPGQESFRTRPLLDANCWAIVPEGDDHVGPGQHITIAPLYPDGLLQPPGL
ncbi:MAG TPA: molybdopterin molybdenumtransferase MoeA [Chromatiales bacterium]|nr:molybdopterin molybdenumtransferase MoeA [Chromatiales bacterium]